MLVLQHLEHVLAAELLARGQTGRREGVAHSGRKLRMAAVARMARMARMAAVSGQARVAAKVRRRRTKVRST